MVNYYLKCFLLLNSLHPYSIQKRLFRVRYFTFLPTTHPSYFFHFLLLLNCKIHSPLYKISQPYLWFLYNMSTLFYRLTRWNIEEICSKRCALHYKRTYRNQYTCRFCRQTRILNLIIILATQWIFSEIRHILIK